MQGRKAGLDTMDECTAWGHAGQAGKRPIAVDGKGHSVIFSAEWDCRSGPKGKGLKGQNKSGIGNKQALDSRGLFPSIHSAMARFSERRNACNQKDTVCMRAVLQPTAARQWAVSDCVQHGQMM